VKNIDTIQQYIDTDFLTIKHVKRKRRTMLMSGCNWWKSKVSLMRNSFVL